MRDKTEPKFTVAVIYESHYESLYTRAVRM